jgi:hypothetical protein
MGDWCSELTQVKMRQFCFFGIAQTLADREDLDSVPGLCAAATDSDENRLYCTSMTARLHNRFSKVKTTADLCKAFKLTGWKLDYCERLAYSSTPQLYTIDGQ